MEKEKVINIIYQEIQLSTHRALLWSKDVVNIIASYYLMIPIEFKMELKEVMQDRINRKLTYTIHNKDIYQDCEQWFSVKSKMYGRMLSRNFYNLKYNETDLISCCNTKIIHIRYNAGIGKSLKNLPKKNFNRLTKEEFLALE